MAYFCNRCKVPIEAKVARYSQYNFQRYLCRECQKQPPESTPEEQYTSKYLSNGSPLDKEKREIVGSDSVILGQQTCVVAGPGTGKTHLLQHLIVHHLLLSKALHCGPQRVCALSFNKRIAETLYQKMNELAREFGLNTNSVRVGTIHSIALENSIYANNRATLVLPQYFAKIPKAGTVDFCRIVYEKILPRLRVSSKKLRALYGFDEELIQKQISSNEAELRGLIAVKRRNTLLAEQEYLQMRIKCEGEIIQDKFFNDLEIIKNFIEQFENDAKQLLVRIRDEEKLELEEIKSTSEEFEFDDEEHKKVILDRIRSFALSKLLLSTVIQYQLLKKDNNWHDFNDYLISCRDMLRHLKEHNPEEYSGRTYDYLLVDEFQDVNPLHMEIISLLLTPDSKFTAVGDPRQSIYAWNGSDTTFIRGFRTLFPESKSYNLTNCYRCPRKVVSLANAITRSESEKEGFRELTGVNNDDGLTLGIPCLKFSKFENEARFWAKFITDELLIKRKCAPQDILVLSRTNDPLEVFEKILNGHLNRNRKLLEKAGHGNTKARYFQSNDQKAAYPASNEYVGLMSIHKAKGSESKVVIIIQASDIRPKEKEYLARIIGNFGSADEERNVFFVAVTRTKEFLGCSFSSPNFMGFPATPSIFIQESKDHFEFEDERQSGKLISEFFSEVDD